MGNQGSDRAVDDVDVAATWDGLTSGPRSQLVDVRTRAEWTYVGIRTSVRSANGAVLVEWQTFPDQTVDARFVERSRRRAQSARRAAWMTTSILFAVRVAGAWLRPERWLRRGTVPVTTLRAASKGRLTICGTVAPSVDGKRPVSPGCKASREDLTSGRSRLSASNFG